MSAPATMAKTPTEMKTIQLSYLLAIQHAANETLKNIGEGILKPHRSSGDQSLTAFQKYLCKLAEVAQTEKGGDTISALVCLKRSVEEGGGAEFLLTSNSRNDGKLADTAKFLQSLLEYAADNPDHLNEKPLQRRIMDRMIEFGYRRFKCYLQQLLIALDGCVRESEGDAHSARLGVQAQLKELRDRANFPQDIECSQNAKAKFMKNCDTLIKAIEHSKNGGTFESWIESCASTQSASPHWESLQHHLGRVHSFRRAAARIAEAPSLWPQLFENFSVNFVSSGRKKSLAHSRSTNMTDILAVAFPDSDLAEFVPLQKTAFEYTLVNQRIDFTMIHGEVNLHHHLHQKGYIEPANFWDRTPFIATSKPPCQACHYYFTGVGNNFQVQAAHMNLYPKWRLPNGCDEAILDEILYEIQAETRQVLSTGTAWYKRFDSKTDSTRMSVRTPISSPPPSRLDVHGRMNMIPRAELHRDDQPQWGPPYPSDNDPFGLDDDDYSDWEGLGSPRQIPFGLSEGQTIGAAR